MAGATKTTNTYTDPTGGAITQTLITSADGTHQNVQNEYNGFSGIYGNNHHNNNYDSLIFNSHSNETAAGSSTDTTVTKNNNHFIQNSNTTDGSGTDQHSHISMATESGITNFVLVDHTADTVTHTNTAATQLPAERESPIAGQSGVTNDFFQFNFAGINSGHENFSDTHSVVQAEIERGFEARHVVIASNAQGTNEVDHVSYYDGTTDTTHYNTHSGFVIS